MWTNREATALTEMPRRLLILGGGPVGVEMAQAFARWARRSPSSRAWTTCFRASRGRSARRSARRLPAEGVELRLGRTRRRHGATDDDYVLAFPDGSALRGDRLLVATGRRPRVDGLGLETVGIEPGPRGIAVDARMAPASACGRSAT